MTLLKKGCSCKEECSTTRDCCFLHNPVTEDETCMYLRSKSTKTYIESTSDLLLNAFYVVTKSPVDGCVDERFGGECNENNTSLLAPVFSTEREKIYFNRECAACHGVTKVIEWDSALICDDLGSSTSIDFDKEMAAFLHNPAFSACLIVYYTFGLPAIGNRRCLIQKVQTEESMPDEPEDSQTEPVNTFFNMSMKDLRDACRSEFYAPVLIETSSKNKWYQNPFCFAHEEGRVDNVSCFPMSNNVIRVKYFTLLNPSVTEILQSNREYKNTKLVCFKTESADLGNKYSTCRPIFCPNGYVRSREGKCNFIGTVLSDGRSNMVAQLQLEPVDNAMFNVQSNVTKNDIVNALNLPTEWKLSLIAKSIYNTRDRGTIKNEILVRILSTTRQLDKALETLKSHLEYNIVIHKGELNLTYKQSIFPQSLIHTAVITKAHLPPVTLCTKQRRLALNVSLYQNHATCWNSIYRDGKVYLLAVQVTKLYLCSIVELTTGEFRLFANDSVLFFVLRKVYLYDKEFMVVVNDNGNKSVKICVEDSGFVPLTGDGSTPRQNLHIILYMSVVLGTFLSNVNLSVFPSSRLFCQ